MNIQVKQTMRLIVQQPFGYWTNLRHSPACLRQDRQIQGKIHQD